jgi:hypothetical protein
MDSLLISNAKGSYKSLFLSENVRFIIDMTLLISEWYVVSKIGLMQKIHFEN